MREFTIERLDARHAAAIARCFQEVYGDSYANELFYDVPALADALARGRLCSVGAIAPDARIVGHMAMVCHPEARYPELGNTVVTPAARGGGLAWEIGSELTAWAVERGYPAYLHYPTTDHHIMQRQSVKSGFETGLMLGYIPAETDGQVNSAKPVLRGAATIVVNPLGECPAEAIHCPRPYAALIEMLAVEAGVPRTLSSAARASLPDEGDAECETFPRRGLGRLAVRRVGPDIDARLDELTSQPCACLHADFLMSDTGIDAGVARARAHGFTFCGWLPGYRATDVLRMQRVDLRVTDTDPAVINPTARTLLERYRTERDRPWQDYGEAPKGGDDA